MKHLTVFVAVGNSLLALLNGYVYTIRRRNGSPGQGY